MQYTPHVPRAQGLSRAVEVMFCLEDYAPPHAVERLVPNGRLTLIIELDERPRHLYDRSTRQIVATFTEAWLSGVQSEYLLIGEVGPARLAAVQFTPGYARPLIHHDLSVFHDRVVPAVEVFGPSITELRSLLREKADGASVNVEVEAWLSERYDAAFEPPPIVTETIEALLRAPGDLAFTEFVAERASVSYKHFVSLFKAHAGATPKRLQRVLRFSEVVERVAGADRIDWAALSAALGYADQAHFIRDFVAFSGYRPRDFLESGHDRANFFPDDPGGEGPTG